MNHLSSESETNLDRIQRIVFSCDTEAGYKLRYLITRAQVDEKFASEISFSKFFNELESCRLLMLFGFQNTVEGYNYWRKVSNWTVLHSTSKADDLLIEEFLNNLGG